MGISDILLNKIMGTEIESKDIVSLIKEASGKNYSKVLVKFKPAYNHEIHKNLNENLKNSLKVSKVSVFNIADEAWDIIQLLDSKDIETMYFI